MTREISDVPTLTAPTLGRNGSLPADPVPAFAAATRERPRTAALIVAGVCGLLVVYCAALALSVFVHPRVPDVRLPAYEPIATTGPRAPAATTTGLGARLPDSGSQWIGLGLFAVAGLALGATKPWRGSGPTKWPDDPGPASVATAAPTGTRIVRRASRRAGWWWPLPLILGLLVVVLSLAAHAYTNSHIARDQPDPYGYASLGQGTGPVVDLASYPFRSASPQPRTVALTFDDGPDPTWTPAVLRVLARANVPATFFVIGKSVTAHPEIVEQAVREGHEIGVHTYRHEAISTQSPATLSRDIALTQTAINGATGMRTALFRPPFITDASSVGGSQYLALKRASREGYLVVLSDLDSTDWSRPGVDAIVRRALPSHDRGVVIEFHDGGGPRGQTVRALSRVIDRLQARDYRFVTVSEVARLPEPGAVQPTAFVDGVRGFGFVRSVGLAHQIAGLFTWLILLVALLALVRLGLSVVSALVHARRTAHGAIGARVAEPGATPPVSVIVAAYNEEGSIAGTLGALCASDIPELEIVVVDDGSCDGTAHAARAVPDPRIRVLSRPHLGKALALASGLGATRHDIVITVDADTQVEPGTLAALVAPFQDPTVGGVAGNPKVTDRRGFLGAAQHVEYVMGNNLDRRMLDLAGTQATIAGAIGAYRRVALDDIGGFGTGTVAEDTDATLAVIEAGWKVRYAPDARAATETPGTWRELWRQRSRWSFGIAQAAWRHRRAARSPGGRPSVPGLCALAYVLVFQILLPLAAPLVDLAAIWGLATGDRALLVPCALFFAVQLVAAAIALRLEGESWRGLWVFPFQLVAYRQVTSVVAVQSMTWALAGRRVAWRSAPPSSRPPVVVADPVESEDRATPSLPDPLLVH